MIERPPDAHMLDAIWVFKIKKDSKNNIKGFRAWLCIRGCKQIAGVEYENTCAPVARYESFRILFSIAAHLDLELVQFDIRLHSSTVSWT